MLNNVIKQRNQSRSQDSSKSLSESKLNETNADDSTLKWNFIELNFYNFNYDDKILNNNNASMKHVEKNIYFKNVHLFVIKVKEIAMTVKEALKINH